MSENGTTVGTPEELSTLELCQVLVLATRVAGECWDEAQAASSGDDAIRAVRRWVVAKDKLLAVAADVERRLTLEGSWTLSPQVHAKARQVIEIEASRPAGHELSGVARPVPRLRVVGGEG